MLTKLKGLGNNATRHMVTHTPHILLVESDQDTRGQYEQFLMQEGYTVTAVSDGRSAINQLARSHCDLVITDDQVRGTPHHGMSGSKFVRTLRRWKKNMPMILMSTHPNVALLAAQYRAHGYFHKGTPMKQLAESVTALLPSG